MSFNSVTNIRNLSGVDSDLMSDAQIQDLIDMVEVESKKWINTAFTPTREIDIEDGNGQDFFFTNRSALLSVKQLTVDDDVIDVETIHTHRPSGKIQFGSNSGKSIFVRKKQSVKIDYLYGLLENSSTETSLSVASIDGSTVVLSVASETGFAVDDWISISGMDGNEEAAKITATAVGTITVDQLVLDHAASSRIIKLQIPEHVKGFMRFESAIACAIYATGNTYTFNASYSLGELSVVKGVPFTHWRESFSQLVKERNFRAGKIKIRPAIVVN